MTTFCSYTQAVSRARHWSITLSMTFTFVQCCATHSTGADTARRCHLRVSCRPAVALQPRSYNPRGSYLGCLGATGREKWSPASLSIKVQLCHVPYVQVSCPVGIWNCHLIFSWCMATASPSAVLHDNNRHSLSLQVAQKAIPYTRVLTPQQIPLRLCWTSGVLVADVLVHFKFHKVVRQQSYGEAKILTSSYFAIPCWI